MTPSMELRFVKRRVGANVVRILQQKWIDEMTGREEWQDIPMAKDEDTIRKFPPEGS